jgi:hypothetical protein
MFRASCVRSISIQAGCAQGSMSRRLWDRPLSDKVKKDLIFINFLDTIGRFRRKSMRKIVHWIVALAFFAVPTIAKAKTEKPAVERVVPITNLSFDQFGEIMLGMHPKVAVEFKPTDPTSMEFLHHFGLFSVQHSPGTTFTVEKTFYLRCINHKFYISDDLVNWTKTNRYFNSAPDLKWERKGSALRLHTTTVHEDQE